MKGTFNLARDYPRLADEIDAEVGPRRGFNIIIVLPWGVRGSTRVIATGKKHRVVLARRWNGSYHEAVYEATIVITAWGSGKFRRANRLARRDWARDLRDIRLDPNITRFRARALVREGD